MEQMFANIKVKIDCDLPSQQHPETGGKLSEMSFGAEGDKYTNLAEQQQVTLLAMVRSWIDLTRCCLI